jgi:protein TonB
MFNNLIESRSHAEELKRRGSFFLLTTTTYVVLFAITGVVSIYAYDAHLESQNTELEVLTFVPIEPIPEAAPEVVRNTIAPASNSNNAPVTRSIRTVLIDTTSNPNNVPDPISTVASDVPPARRDSVIGTRNADPPTPPASNYRGGSGGTGNTPIVEMPDPPPAPTPKPQPVRTVNISRVLNSKALDLPRPNYPPPAKLIRVQGTVTVQVLIDESGNVVSAKAVSGHPLLIAAAVDAAKRARFSPTLLSDQPVKVSGVITYNFVMP